VAIFTGGAIRHTAVIPIAGDLITSDIAMALRTPTKDAEDIKVESGYAKQLLADPEPRWSAGPGRPQPAHAQQAGAGRRDRAARGRDLLAGAAGDPRVGLRGSAVLGHRAHRRQRVMPGMVELGEDIFLKPVRRGIPKYSSALADMVAQPRAATVMGLLKKRAWRLRGFKVAQERLHEDRVWPLQRLHRGELLT
jgi:cell division protein FtsA